MCYIEKDCPYVLKGRLHTQIHSVEEIEKLTGVRWRKRTRINLRHTGRSKTDSNVACPAIPINIGDDDEQASCDPESAAEDPEDVPDEDLFGLGPPPDTPRPATTPQAAAETPDPPQAYDPYATGYIDNWGCHSPEAIVAARYRMRRPPEEPEDDA